MTVWLFNQPQKMKDKLAEELEAGRLRSGWGLPGMELDNEGEILEKSLWVYKNLNNRRVTERWGGDKITLQRLYDGLECLLKIKPCDLIVVPGFRGGNKFALARACSREGKVYHHDCGLPMEDGKEKEHDFIHYLSIDEDSLKIFSYESILVPGFIKNRIKTEGIKRPAVRLKDLKIEQALRVCWNSEDPAKNSQPFYFKQNLKNAVIPLEEKINRNLKELSREEFAQIVENILLSEGFKIKSRHLFDGSSGEVDLLAERIHTVMGRRETFEVLIKIEEKWEEKDYADTETGEEAAIEEFIRQAECINKNGCSLIYIKLSGGFSPAACRRALKENVTLMDRNELAGLYLQKYLGQK